MDIDLENPEDVKIIESEFKYELRIIQAIFVRSSLYLS